MPVVAFSQRDYEEAKPVSHSALSDSLECRRKHFYASIIKPRLKPGRDVPTWSYVEAGTVMHNKIRDLFRPDGSVKFRSPESFANAVYGMWFQHLKGYGKNPLLVNWRYDAEQFVLANALKVMAERFYEKRVQEPPPFAVETSFIINVPVGLHNLHLSGRFDEVNLGQDSELVVRDYKTRPDSVIRALFRSKEISDYVARALREIRAKKPELFGGLSIGNIAAEVKSFVESPEICMKEDAAFLNEQLTIYAIAAACVLAENATEELRGCGKSDRFYGIFDRKVLERISEVGVQLYDVFTGGISETRKTAGDARNIIELAADMKEKDRRNSYPCTVSTGTCPRCFYRARCETDRAAGFHVPEQELLHIESAGENLQSDPGIYIPKFRLARRPPKSLLKQGRLFKPERRKSGVTV